MTDFFIVIMSYSKSWNF